MFKHILLPTDGSPLASKAITAGLRFAREIGARVTVYHALEELPAGLTDEGFAVDPDVVRQFEQIALDRGQSYIDAVRERAERARVRCHTIVDATRPPHAGIVAAATRRRCDVIFMSSHGRRGLKGLLLGSVTHRVLTHSKVPVVVYR